ncbi:hypothetical protein BVRB_029980, partial [Beta vulgaris subsp. vulgaris]
TSLCARDLCTSQVKLDVPQTDLYQLDAAFEPGPAYALWNNEWSSLPRHWTLVYHKCMMQSADDEQYNVLFHGDDVVRQVPIESIPAYNPAYVQYPIVPIDLDVVDQFTTPLDVNDKGQPLEPLEGFLAESGAWHRWDTIKTLSSRGGVAVAPYVLDYGSVPK